MKNLKFSISAFIVFTVTSSIYSQVNLNPSNVLFQNISLREGLSQSTVFDIKQDKLGYIWLTTADGLNRYDGYKFVVYRHDENDSLTISSNSTTSILFDQNDDMWIGTGDGLAKYNHKLNTFTTFRDQKNITRMRVFSLEKWANNEFVVATNLGLYSFSEKNGFRLLNFPSMSFGKTSMVKVGNKILAGADSGIYFYYPETNTYALANKLFSGINAMSMFPDNLDKQRIWIGTEGFGLFHFDIPNNKLIQYKHDKNNPKSISSDFIRSLCYDSQHRLWIGTFVGLNVLNEDNKHFTRFYNNYKNDGTISQNSIRSIFSDNQGGLWFGTYYGGLNYYHPLKTQFEHIYHIQGENSLNDNVVSCMLAEPNGDVWIGTNDKGLDHYSKDANYFEHFKNVENNPNSISGNNVKTLLKLDDGNLLVGTHGGGLNYFDVKSRKFSKVLLSKDQMANDNVYGLVKYSNKNIWVATLNGLFQLNLTTKKAIPFEQIVPASKKMDKKVLSLFIDSKKILWIGTNSGVYKYSMLDGNFQKILFDDNVKTEKIIVCFFEHSSGRIWVGTNEGLFYVKENKMISHKLEDFPDYHICSIEEDQFRMLWISTYRGLINLTLNTNKWRIYTESDGLQSNQFNDYSSCKTTDNKMYFGGINGITVFYPEKLIDNPYAPAPIIDKLTVFNKLVTPNDKTNILQQSIELTKSIQLKPKFNVFELEFVVPNFIAGQKNTFAYKLDGFDNEWYTTEKNSVSYSNLTPGKYLFRVKAANNNGKWSSEVTVLKIEVLPHWYYTWWAKTLFFSLILFILFVSIRFFIKRKIVAKELDLERINIERIKEVDQAKIRFFVNVSHEFRSPLTLILSPVREMLEKGVKERWVQQQLNLIERNAERMLHMVNQVLDYRKTELGAMPLNVKQLEIEPFVKKNFDLFVQMAKKKEFEYQFNSTTSNQEVYIDPNYLERILSNLLSNAFKYSAKGGSISLNLNIKDDFTCIEVVDTGSGIPKEKLQRVFDRFYQEDDNTQGTGIGLSLVKNLVESHHGKITLESEINKGSKFTVMIPSKSDSYEKNEISSAKNSVIDDEKINYENENSQNDSFEQVVLTEIEQTETDITDIENQPDKQRKNILLVEDDEEIRHYLAKHLNSEYNVIEAENGKMAWEILQKNEEIELIISDLMMPVLDGLALCKMVKQNIQYCHIPFLLLTAKNEVVHQLKGLQIGADDYIGKPFIYSILKTKIDNIFKQQKRIILRYSSTLELNTQELVSSVLDEEFINRAIGNIEKNIDNQEYSVEDFSSDMFMSRSGLHLKIKAITGESARDFIRKVRLSYAVKLLKEGKYNVTEISEMSGFSPTYFSTIFKKYAGCMPSKFVKNNQNQRD